MRIACRSCVITVLALFACSFAVFAEDAIPKPVIAVDAAVHSFGTVPQGAIIKHDFVVKNAGTQDLIIQKATPSCGCTAALPPNGPIPPGQSASISVTFDTSGFEGDKEKTVRIFSNDIENPQPVLTLKGRVETALNIDPVRVSFGDVAQNEYVDPKVVSVVVKDGVQGSIKEISTFSKSLTVTTKSNDGKKAQAAIGLSPELAPGELRDRALVTLAYADGREQTFNVPVVANVQAGIMVQPRTVSFGVIEGNEAIVRQAKIVNALKEEFSIQSVTSDSDKVQVSYKTLKPGKIYIVNVSVNPRDVTTDLRAAVKITTSSKEQPSLTLNVYGIVPYKK